MSLRFICPHCHSPLDPAAMEVACDGDAQLRVCPNCDEAVVLDPVATGIAPAATARAPHPPSAPR